MKKINLIILILMVVSYTLAIIPQSVNAVTNWYNTAWLYRKTITVNGTASGAQTNYQLPIKVYFGSGTDGTETISQNTYGKVYLNAKCKIDFTDLRFTKSDGITLLDYWIETSTNSTSAIVWVEFDYIASGTTMGTTFYLYYGNSTAVSAASGDNTFLFFDDFSGTFPGTKWTGTTAIGAIASGWLVVTGDGVSKSISSNSTSTGGFNTALRMSSNLTQAAANVGNTRLYATGHLAGMQVNTTPYHENYNGVYNSTSSNFTTNSTHTFDILLRGGVNSRILEDNIECSNSPYVTTPPAGTGYYARIEAIYAGVCVRVDWILTRKYVYLEPTFGAWGSEEFFNTINNLVIQDVKVFETFKSSGDWLFVIRYLNTYPPYYDSFDIKQCFVFQLLDSTNAVRAQSQLMAWGNRPGCIYMAASSVTALEWGVSTYKIRIYGTITGNPYVEYTLTATDWIGVDLTNLDSWVISSAKSIQTYTLPTVLTLIATVAQRGEVLNATGGSMFDLGIPGLSLVRPNIFQTYSSTGSPRNLTIDTSYIGELKNWQRSWGADGTIMLNRVGAVFGIDGGVIGSIFFLIPMLALMIWGFMPSSSHAASILSVPVFLGSVYFGTDPLFIVMIGLLAAFLFIKQWWIDK